MNAVYRIKIGPVVLEIDGEGAESAPTVILTVRTKWWNKEVKLKANESVNDKCSRYGSQEDQLDRRDIQTAERALFWRPTADHITERVLFWCSIMHIV